MNVQTNSAMWDFTFDIEIMAAIEFNTKITDTHTNRQTNIPTAMCVHARTHVHTHTHTSEVFQALKFSNIHICNYSNVTTHTHTNVQTNSAVWDVIFDVEIMAAIKFNTKTPSNIASKGVALEITHIILSDELLQQHLLLLHLSLQSK